MKTLKYQRGPILDGTFTLTFTVFNSDLCVHHEFSIFVDDRVKDSGRYLHYGGGLSEKQYVQELFHPDALRTLNSDTTALVLSAFDRFGYWVYELNDGC